MSKQTSLCSSFPFQNITGYLWNEIWIENALEEQRNDIDATGRSWYENGQITKYYRAYGYVYVPQAKYYSIPALYSVYAIPAPISSIANSIMHATNV